MGFALISGGKNFPPERSHLRSRPETCEQKVVRFLDAMGVQAGYKLSFEGRVPESLALGEVTVVGHNSDRSFVAIIRVERDDGCFEYSAFTVSLKGNRSWTRSAVRRICNQAVANEPNRKGLTLMGFGEVREEEGGASATVGTGVDDAQPAGESGSETAVAPGEEQIGAAGEPAAMGLRDWMPPTREEIQSMCADEAFGKRLASRFRQQVGEDGFLSRAGFYTMLRAEMGVPSNAEYEAAFAEAVPSQFLGKVVASTLYAETGLFLVEKTSGKEAYRVWLRKPQAVQVKEECAAPHFQHGVAVLERKIAAKQEQLMALHNEIERLEKALAHAREAEKLSEGE